MATNLLFPPRREPAGPAAPWTLYRSITSADRISNPSALAAGAGRINGAGVLVSGTSYNLSVANGNRYGDTTASAVEAVTPGGGNNAIRQAIVQATGAEWYDLFLSTAANPLWVARVTETQRAAGAEITAVGTVGAGSVAGSVDFDVVGTGLANNVAPFANNNAYVLPAGVAAIPCAGYSQLDIMYELTVTDLRSLPAATLHVFGANDASGNYGFMQAANMTVLSAGGQPLIQRVTLACYGLTGVHVLCSAALTGQGTAVAVYYQLK